MMFSVKKSVLGGIGAVALVAGVLASGSPALAATHTGVTKCTGTRSAIVVTNSSTYGSGTITNIVTSSGVTYYFPAGYHAKGAYPQTSWTVNNGSGFWYSTPYGTCG